MVNRRAWIVLAVAAAGLAATPAAAAPRPEYVSVNSYIPARIDATIGFVPSHGMPPTRIARVRSGGRTFRFVYLNSAVVWPRTSMILSELSGRYASTAAGGFVDRPLTAKQRRRLVVRLDLGRDADVLAVAKDHPACATGLTTAQARGIARGTITRWSEVVAGAPGAIAVRVEQSSTGAKVPRWEAREYAKGTKGAADGGLGAAAQGDQAVAALTSWSRARAYAATTCSVPIDGVAPTDASVFALSYPAAFPISYVVPRRPFRATRYGRAVMRGFVDWLGGSDAAKQFRARGMMLVADGPPAPPPPPPPPEEPPPEDAIPVEEPAVQRLAAWRTR
jgi:hypothetical protein